MNSKLPLKIPTEGVAKFVEDLPNERQIAYSCRKGDEWAEAVTRLTGDKVRSVHTSDLLVALGLSMLA